MNESQAASIWTVCSKQNAALLNLFLFTPLYFIYFFFKSRGRNWRLWMSTASSATICRLLPDRSPATCHWSPGWFPFKALFLLRFFFLLNNLPRLSLPTCQTVAAELVQHLTPFTKGANRDSCYLGEGGRRRRRKKRCFAVIWDERLAVDVRRPLAFIWRSASSRSNTDVLRSDFETSWWRRRAERSHRHWTRSAFVSGV